MENPHALVKDLRSSGYFYDELKGYSQSPEMDVRTYCVYFASPYLVKVAESYEKAGRPEKSRILRLAIKHLSNPSDDEVVDSIFGLKRVASAEIAKADKAVFQDILNKTLARANRQKLESAEFLVKLLVNIIKAFKLAEPIVKQDKAAKTEDPIEDAIARSWEDFEL